MNFCYTYCSFNGKTLPTDDFFAKMAKLSVVSLGASVTGEIILYADNAAADYFTQKEIVFDKIKIVDFTKYDTDPRYWNFGKLLTYHLQEEPFLHVDFDTVFLPGFYVPEADIITEKIRPYKRNIDFERHEIPNYPAPKKLVCSGLIGMNGNTEEAKFCFDRVFYKAQFECKNGAKKTINERNLIGIEEYALTQLIEQRNLTVAELDSNFYAHFQGANKKKEYGPLINKLYYKFGCNTDWMTL